MSLDRSARCVRLVSSRTPCSRSAWPVRPTSMPITPVCFAQAARRDSFLSEISRNADSVHLGGSPIRHSQLVRCVLPVRIRTAVCSHARHVIQALCHHTISRPALPVSQALFQAPRERRARHVCLASSPIPLRIHASIALLAKSRPRRITTAHCALQGHSRRTAGRAACRACLASIRTDPCLPVHSVPMDLSLPEMDRRVRCALQEWR